MVKSMKMRMVLAVCFLAVSFLVGGFVLAEDQVDVMVLMDNDKNLVWAFQEQYAVAVQVVGEGAVLGLAAPWQDAGASINLEAVAAEYWRFSHWHDGSQSNSATFAVSNALDVVAHFELVRTQGVPHAWLASFGLIDPDTVDIAGVLADDPDEDGHSTWQEYLAGTDPTLAESVLRVSAEAGGLTLHNLATGRTYRVKFSADLVDWSSITNFVVPAPGNKTVARESEGFYRAVVELTQE